MDIVEWRYLLKIFSRFTGCPKCRKSIKVMFFQMEHLVYYLIFRIYVGNKR